MTKRSLHALETRSIWGRQDFKRWISLKPYHRTDWYEEFDEQLLGNIALPKSETLESHRMAFGRRVDKVVIAALADPATTGEEGTETTALPASQIVAVNYTGGTPANSNLTLAKLIKAKSILGKNEVTGFDAEDQKEIIFVYTQDQLDNLLENVDEIKNSDYTQVKGLSGRRGQLLYGNALHPHGTPRHHFRHSLLLRLCEVRDQVRCGSRDDHPHVHPQR